ncbi:MAG: ATPase, T2SS/T4P/T4SS family, partial [Mycoplasmatales bacterium]
MKISDQMYLFIFEANKLNASDIHFHPIENRVKIYYRIVDKLVFQKEIDIVTYTKMLRFIKFKTRLDISITKFPQDGAFNLKNENMEKIFIRVSTIPLVDNESLVIRILPDEYYNSFNEIAFYEKDLDKMYNQLRNSNGLFVFTGPTGSGKTTSMYSILNKLAIKDYKK